jgi:trans-aconitate methyltransferase
MRIPEPEELMIDILQCQSYNKFSSNSDSLNNYVELYNSLIGVSEGNIIDLGSGPCNFVVALAKKYPKLNFTCYEKSDAMLKIAKDNIAGLEKRITLINDDIRNARGKCDVILANRIFHHFDDPIEFWKIIDQFKKTFLVVDINRPSESHIRNIERSINLDSIYKKDLINSLKAAWTLKEVKEQTKEYNFKIRSNRDDNEKLIVYQIR